MIEHHVGIAPTPPVTDARIKGSRGGVFDTTRTAM
jgi:hypothetical protein